jgi:hypothetical protein
MILDRFDNHGKIKNEYRLDFIQQKKANGNGHHKKVLEQTVDLFAQMEEKPSR